MKMTAEKTAKKTARNALHHRTRLFAVAALAAVGVAMAPLLVCAQGPTSLQPAIDAQYPGGQWVTRSELHRWLEEDDAPVLLDARTREEYAVSHIRGARRVDPDRPQLDSLDLPEGARVVVYCSVGYRSADIAAQLKDRGVTNVYNLLGGIFEWANEGCPLYRGSERVQQVHPYDATWGAMVDDERRAPLP